MKITCSRQELVEVLSNVSRAAYQKSPLKVLEGILFKAYGNEIYLCCYNLEIGIARTISATVSESGDVIMPLRLCEYARRMNGETITIECNEKYAVHITSGYASYDIIGMPAIDFPELPQVDTEQSLKIKENILRSMISQTAYAVSNRADMPPQYSGVLFELSQSSIRLVALDGYRVAVREEQNDCDVECTFIIPSKTVSEISKLLSDTDDECELCIAKHNMICRVNGYSLISRLMSGTFMNYQNTIDAIKGNTATVKTSDMIAAVERVSLIASEADRSPICCMFCDSRINFICETGTSRAVDNMSCECSADKEIEIGFNHRYLLDALRAADDENVVIVFSDGRSPILIKPVEGDRFRFLLMPVLLKAASPENSVASKAGDPQYRESDEMDEPEEEEADFSYGEEND